MGLFAVGEGEAYGNWSKSCYWCGCWCVHCYNNSALGHNFISDADWLVWEVERASLNYGWAKLEGSLRGIGVSLLLTCNPAIQYTVFEQSKRRLLRPDNGSKQLAEGAALVVLSAFRAFVLGAISKTVATILTYPAIRVVKMVIQAAELEEDHEPQQQGPGHEKYLLLKSSQQQSQSGNRKGRLDFTMA